ncbi:hypothetical protein [Ectothiorhodospira lacustris]|uniref:hypothetical protein n=1 Tax=Ectothiorhodospira lacustris TaxID=2899127 RepID=UPI001EE89447|nr:hypothetical protein [Ectothiorhodospira lacustris]MCG5509633.1 hypothetical protein [Ectothiorhodospira lacustris]MCG5521572.1 hypothetical protein [Ectothiorhodospira lacustris]
MNTQKYFRLLDACEDARARHAAARDKLSEAREELAELLARSQNKATAHLFDLWRASADECREIADERRDSPDDMTTADRLGIAPGTMRKIADLKDEVERREANFERIQTQAGPWLNLFPKLAAIKPPVGRGARMPRPEVQEERAPTQAAEVPDFGGYTLHGQQAAAQSAPSFAAIARGFRE